VSRAVEIIVWWVALTALELMLVSAVDRYELLVAVILGLCAALVATGARTAQPTSWRVRARWVRWLLPLPLAILTDTGRVLVAALAGRSGTWREVDLSEAVGSTARARAARAVGALVLNTAPGTVVTAVDGQTGRARVHALGGKPGSGLERAVAS
jgi:hypothetical protein